MQSRFFEFSNATVRVNYADIAEEENKRRLQEIRRSAEIILRAVIKAEEEERKMQ